MTKSLKSCAMAALLATSRPCLAAAPVYFDLGGLLLIGVGIIFGLFVWIGRTKGLIAFLVLAGAFFFYAGRDQKSQSNAAESARQATSDSCFKNAGSFGAALSPAPDRVVVSVDSRLHPSERNPVSAYVSTTMPAPGVEFVSALPSDRSEGVAYVEIALTAEPVEGATDRRVFGITTHVYDGPRLAAHQIDYYINPHWCLGESPPSSIDRFLTSRLGRSIYIEPRRMQGHSPYTRVTSPTGDASALLQGRFSEGVSMDSDGSAMKKRFDSLPAHAQCQDNLTFQRAACLKGTPQENQIYLPNVAAVHELPESWLTISGMSRNALDVEERTPVGEVINTYHVRFANVPDTHAVRNVRVDGRHLTADLLYGRKSERRNPAEKGDAVFTEWYEGKLTVSVQLQPVN